MREILQAARYIARQAGALLRQGFQQPFEVEHKGSVDLVTSVDKASEALILAFIQREFPEHAWLAEESGAQAGSAGARQAAYRWIIDPLDGTVNFAHRNPHFCVLIGVQAQADDGSYTTLYGVTYDPLRDEEFVAARGQGASLQGEPIRVAPTRQLIDSLGVTGFGYNRLLAQPDNHAEFCRLNLLTQGVRRFGSAGLDLAYVACGRYDFYWEYRLFPWDCTPGILLVREAGGVVGDLPGGKLSEGSLLASNATLQPQLQAALQSAQQHPVNARRGLEAFLPANLAAQLQASSMT